MAYDAQVSDPEIITPGDGHRYVRWTIVETDVSPGDIWEITGFPSVATLTLVGTEITAAGSGGISTVQTEVSNESALDADSIDYIDQAASAGSVARIADNKRCPKGGSLYGSSNVDVAGGADSIVTTRVEARIGRF